MSDDSSIGAAMYVPTIFECPNCKETIDTKAETCRFCGVKVDHEAARKAAVLMANVNQACSDASYMRSTALTLPVFFLLRFVPFFNWVGLIGLLVLTLVIPFWALRWWRKYSEIETDDADFRRAQNRVKWIGIIVGCVLVVVVVANIYTFLHPPPNH
jgi:hypothetical protein